MRLHNIYITLFAHYFYGHQITELLSTNLYYGISCVCSESVSLEKEKEKCLQSIISTVIALNCCISSELKPGHYAAAAAGDALTSAHHIAQLH